MVWAFALLVWVLLKCSNVTFKEPYFLDAQQREKNSTNVTTLHVYRDLAILREQPSLQYGILTFGDVTPSILSFLRSARERPDYLVVINFGNVTVTHDFSGSPVNRDQGQVKVVTSQAANEGRFAKDSSVKLTQLTLNPGDGLVIELQDTTEWILYAVVMFNVALNDGMRSPLSAWVRLIINLGAR